MLVLRGNTRQRSERLGKFANKSMGLQQIQRNTRQRPTLQKAFSRRDFVILQKEFLIFINM